MSDDQLALNDDQLTELLRQRLAGPQSGTAGMLMSHLNGSAAAPPPPATSSGGVRPDPTQGGPGAGTPADLFARRPDELERALRQAANRSH